MKTRAVPTKGLPTKGSIWTQDPNSLLRQLTHFSGQSVGHCRMRYSEWTFTVPQRLQGMSLLSIISLVSGGRGGKSTDPASSGVLHITASIWRVNSSPKGLKIASRCVVIGWMDHQPLRRKYGNAHHPILVAKCALSRPADDVETRTPRHWRDAVSRTIRLVAIESWSCFSLSKLNQRIISYVRTLPSNNPGRRTRPTISHTDPKARAPGAGVETV